MLALFSLDTTDMVGPIILCVCGQDCAVHCKDISDFILLDAQNSTPPIRDIKKPADFNTCAWGGGGGWCGKNSLLLRITDLDGNCSPAYNCHTNDMSICIPAHTFSRVLDIV